LPSPKRKEFLSDRWQLSLLLLAEVFFAASVSMVTLAITHRPFGLFLALH